MDTALALHTAARRYCIERHSYWCERYVEIARAGGDRQTDSRHYTREALATFPRYNVLNAIRVELERTDPAIFRDVEEARAFIVLAGEAAEDDFTRHPISEVDARAMNEEREGFCRYVRGLTASAISEVKALPYRRVLTTEESKFVWSRLRSQWQILNDYWYPLVDCSLSDVVAFKAAAFARAVAERGLRDMLAKHGIDRVWELREYGPEYEQETLLLDPSYNGAEGYWSSGDLDWVIYASHEGSVTVAGWILQEVKELWPSWQADIWEMPGGRESSAGQEDGRES